MGYICKGLCGEEKPIRGNYLRNRLRKTNFPSRCTTCRKTMESLPNGTIYCYCCGGPLRNTIRRRTEQKKMVIKIYCFFGCHRYNSPNPRFCAECGEWR